MGVDREEYDRLKEFYFRLLEIETEIEFGRPGDEVWSMAMNPRAALEGLEQESLTKALLGLTQGIRDSLETAGRWNGQQMKRADDYLRGHGVMTVSEAKRRYR